MRITAKKNLGILLSLILAAAMLAGVCLPAQAMELPPEITASPADAVLQRGTFVQMLWNINAQPEYAGQLEFTDVAADAWNAPAIRWAASEGLINGYGDGTFGAADPLTREQFAAILYRYAILAGMDVSVAEDTNILSYDDAFDVDAWAVAAYQWLCGSGVHLGTAPEKLSPFDTISRPEAATLTLKALGRIAPDSDASFISFRLADSDYSILIPAGYSSYVPSGLTEEDYRMGYQGSYANKDFPMEFEVYMLEKTGEVPKDIPGYAAYDAAFYYPEAKPEEFEFTDLLINGIKVVSYYVDYKDDGEDCTDLNFIIDDGDRFVSISAYITPEGAHDMAWNVIFTLMK